MSGFDLTKEVDTSKTITVNYLPMGITNINLDTTQNWISGICGRGASSNVTYVENGVTREFKADKIWIVSNQGGATNLQKVGGVDYNAELFIRNVDTNNGNPMYLCYLLKVSSVGSQIGQIDTITRAATADPAVTSLNVDLNADIFKKSAPGAKYIQYTSKTKGTGRHVFIYSEPINVTAVAILGLENNVESFDMTSTEYSIIQSSVPGDWMECDYVPIDSEDVAVYNLPVASGLVQDQSANQSLKTMVMFILFVVFIGAAYSIIPVAYLYTVKMIYDYFEVTQDSAQREYLSKINTAMTVLLAGTSVILLFIGAGVFGDTSNIPNASLLLLIGMCLGIFYMLGIVILKSRTSIDKNWPIAQIQEEMARR
jgi:hypothetical protein